MAPEYVLDRLEADVQLYVAEHARRRIFVRAGVVGWKRDEYAPLDPKGRVHPNAPLSSVRDGRPLLENAVPARSRPKASLATFREVVSAARLVRGARGEAREMAEALLERVE